MLIQLTQAMHIDKSVQAFRSHSHLSIVQANDGGQLVHKLYLEDTKTIKRQQSVYKIYWAF